MKMSLLSVLFVSAFAVAQQTPSLPKIPQVPSTSPAVNIEVMAGTATLAPASDQRLDAARLADVVAEPSTMQAPAPLATVLFDEPGDGMVWAAAPLWKAGFDGTAATFVPFLGSDAPKNYPTRFMVSEVMVAGSVLPVVAGLPSRVGDLVAIDRGAMVEQYWASLAGIEQRFVFDKLPSRGELTVTIAVASEFGVTSDNGAHHFVHALGSFDYGAAIAIDGHGRTVAVASEVVNGAIRLRVPEAFVAGAALPLVIDPLIGNVVSIGSSVVHHGATDLAFDASRNEYFVCWERRFSGVDSDVLCVRCDAALQPIAAQAYIDASTTSWRGCRVAGLDLYDKFLVVCECEVVGQPTFIAGRVYDAAAVSLSAQIDIERGALACSSPDIGGDPFPAGPVYWTVVYERHASSLDHDILLRQVQSDGVLRGSGATPIDTSVSMEHSPRISKSDGRDGSSTSQRWCIAYRREGSGMTSVRISTVKWDGIVDPNQVVSPWYPATDNYDLVVSTPTFESLGRAFLVVETRRFLPTTNRVPYGILVRENGQSLSGWTQLMDYVVDRLNPAVACDGARFVVGFSSPATPGNYDTYLRLIDRVGNQLVGNDLVVCSQAPTNDGRLSIISMASGGATTSGDRQYAAVWNAGGPVADVIRGIRYQGMASTGGAVTRSTGCGSLQVGHPNLSEFAAIGSTIQVYVQNPSGIVGWGIGAPASVALPGCGSCLVGTTLDVLTVGATVQVPLPYSGALVGLTFAFQAFSVGQGTCLGSLELSDTIDVTIR